MNDLCGIRLSTVSVVVGWFSFIGGIFSTIVLIVAFTRLDEVVKMIEERVQDAENVDIRAAVVIALCIYLTVSLANVFSSAMLIVGTIKERHLLLTPWLINAYIFIFFNVLNFIYMIYVAIATTMPIGSVIFGILVAGLSLAIQCTIWNAIYSLYRHIRANREMQQCLLPTSGSSYSSNDKATPPSN